MSAGTAQAPRPGGGGLTTAVALSLLGHAGVFGLLWLVTVVRPHLRAPPQQVLTTKLVRLGTPRPETMLPRKEPPPTPAAPPPPEKAPPPPPPSAPEPGATAGGGRGRA